jgi:hypothetical protein
MGRCDSTKFSQETMATKGHLSNPIPHLQAYRCWIWGFYDFISLGPSCLQIPSTLPPKEITGKLFLEDQRPEAHCQSIYENRIIPRHDENACIRDSGIHKWHCMGSTELSKLRTWYPKFPFSECLRLSGIEGTSLTLLICRCRCMDGLNWSKEDRKQVSGIDSGSWCLGIRKRVGIPFTSMRLVCQTSRTANHNIKPPNKSPTTNAFEGRNYLDTIRDYGNAKY